MANMRARAASTRQDSLDNVNGMGDISLPIPDELIEALARRVAELVLVEMDNHLRPLQGRWLRAKEAAIYLGWTRSALYSRVHDQSIPHYKVDRMLLFKRDELDRWLEQHRVELADTHGYREPLAQPTRAKPSSIRRTSRSTEKRLGDLIEKPARKRRERPLPPPLGATKEQKDRWTRELEITRAELDEMSPTEFEKAWEARNERLETAGVFDHLTELEDKYGKDMWSMSASQLIEAVREFRTRAES
jgi:excisionase family DNA binding protein